MALVLDAVDHIDSVATDVAGNAELSPPDWSQAIDSSGVYDRSSLQSPARGTASGFPGTVNVSPIRRAPSCTRFVGGKEEGVLCLLLAGRFATRTFHAQKTNIHNSAAGVPFPGQAFAVAYQTRHAACHAQYVSAALRDCRRVYLDACMGERLFFC